MPLAKLDRVHIHYELTGEPRHPVLALSHSLGVNLSMWQPQIAALRRHFRVLCYDTRGHGQSSLPEGPYAMSDLGQDVLRLMDSLGIEQASFCGISMGGLIGQWLAVNAPHRLTKQVLANTAAKIGTAEGWNARISTVAEQGLGPVIPGTLERWFTPDFRAAHPDTIAATEDMLRATSPQGYIACCAALRDADFRSNLVQIEIPTLVVSGTHDPVTPTEDAKFLAATIPAATHVELPTAHLSCTEAAEDFNAAVLDFLLS